MKSHNDNVKVNVFQNTNYIDNENVNDRYARSKKVEEIADMLLMKLGLDQGSRPFMCKVAWKLSEACIWGNLEKAQNGSKNPVGLFIFLCKRDGV